MNQKKSNKDNDKQFTPEDLSAMSDKQHKKEQSTLVRLGLKRDGSSVSMLDVMKKAALTIMALILVLMGISYAVSAILNFSGNFTASIINPDDKHLLSLSTTPDFTEMSTLLKATPINNMDNITYTWLPENLDNVDGDHNGDNYIAYTFYLKNMGTQSIDYNGEIIIAGVSKSLDEAARVMVYKNGVPTIYGKQKRNTDGEPEDELKDLNISIVNFEAQTKVMSTRTENLAVGEMDKYTVVIWLEGEDPECVNDVLGGTLRMRMDFSITNIDG